MRGRNCIAATLILFQVTTPKRQITWVAHAKRPMQLKCITTLCLAGELRSVTITRNGCALTLFPCVHTASGGPAWITERALRRWNSFPPFTFDKAFPLMRRILNRTVHVYYHWTSTKIERFAFLVQRNSGHYFFSNEQRDSAVTPRDTITCNNGAVADSPGINQKPGTIKPRHLSSRARIIWNKFSRPRQ